jgi:hypothetical protein
MNIVGSYLEGLGRGSAQALLAQRPVAAGPVGPVTYAPTAPVLHRESPVLAALARFYGYGPSAKA